MAILVVSGCGKKVSRTATLSMTQEAESLYTYGDERPPVDIVDHDFPGKPVDESKVPRVTIATANADPSAPAREGRVLARITSSGDFPEFGLKQGPNYLWRVPSGTSADSLNQIFPAGEKTMSYQLTRDPRGHEYTPGDKSEPRLVKAAVHSVALGVCLEDSFCQPSGHCGYY